MEYLYHYTSIHALVMILKNRQIKFNMLKNLDDPQEQEIMDPYPLSKYVFVSSWTSRADEHIPMWNMYTDLEFGVRIGLEKNPFETYEISAEEAKRIPTDVFFGAKQTIVPFDELANRPYFMTTMYERMLLNEVIYTDESDKLKPKLVSFRDGHTSVAFDNIGKHKNNYWAFQEEWRYILNFIPVSFQEMVNDRDNIAKNFSRFLDLPFIFYYLKIREDAFENMEIVLSPKISDSGRTIVELLMEKYNPDAKLLESDLVNKIR